MRYRPAKQLVRRHGPGAHHQLLPVGDEGVEGQHQGQPLVFGPEFPAGTELRELPLAGIEDVKARIYGLHLRARGMTPGYDDEIARRTINEALELYTTALRRLASLRDEAAADRERAAA